MSQITTKPRIRLTAEAMPQHCLVPPERAPDCYGDSEARILGSACVRCRFRVQCADFTDRARQDDTHGIANDSLRRQRCVWPNSAPLVLDPDRFRECVSASASRPLTGAEERLWALVEQSVDGGEMAITSRCAYSGGLISVDAAAEIAVRGELFHCWLSSRNSRQRRVRDESVATLVWVTAAIALRALLGQSRPPAFGPRLHHEVWAVTTDRKMSRSALRKRLPRINGLHRRFEGEFRARS